MSDDDAIDLRQVDLPPGAGGPLKAVWHGVRGEWDTAHILVQDDPTAAAAWVHAWLHRIEGDDANAAYWYRRARRAVPRGSTEAEAQAIAAALMRDEPNG